MSAPGLRQLAIDDACAGMLLGADLSDSHGVVLLPAGASLTDPILASLRRRGIEQLSVQAPAELADSAAREAMRVQQLARLTQLFRQTGQHVANQALLQLLQDYRRDAP